MLPLRAEIGAGEHCVVKVLGEPWASRPESRERFRREAVSLARLRHPGTVAVHDFGRDGDVLFIVVGTPPDKAGKVPDDVRTMVEALPKG